MFPCTSSESVLQRQINSGGVDSLGVVDSEPVKAQDLGWRQPMGSFTFRRAQSGLAPFLSSLRPARLPSQKGQAAQVSSQASFQLLRPYPRASGTEILAIVQNSGPCVLLPLPSSPIPLQRQVPRTRRLARSKYFRPVPPSTSPHRPDDLPRRITLGAFLHSGRRTGALPTPPVTIHSHPVVFIDCYPQPLLGHLLLLLHISK